MPWVQRPTEAQPVEEGPARNRRVPERREWRLAETGNLTPALRGTFQPASSEQRLFVVFNRRQGEELAIFFLEGLRPVVLVLIAHIAPHGIELPV